MNYYLFLGGFQGGPLFEIQNESWKPLFEHFWPPQERSEAILKGAGRRRAKQEGRVCDPDDLPARRNFIIPLGLFYVGGGYMSLHVLTCHDMPLPAITHHPSSPKIIPKVDVLSGSIFHQSWVDPGTI